MTLKKFLHYVSLKRIWLAVLMSVILASIIPRFSPPGEGIGLDKVFHFLAYAFLSYFPVVGFKKRQQAFTIAVSMSPLGVILEYIQRNISGRQFSPEDMIANNAGVILGLFLGCIVRILKKRQRLKDAKEIE